MDVGKRPSSTDASPARAEAPLALARDATDASPERAEAPLALVRPARDASLGDLSAVEKKRIGRLVKVLVAVESGYARARETWRKEEDGLRAGAAAQAAALRAVRAELDGARRSLGAAPSEPSATDRAIAAETALRTTTRELAAARRAAHGAAARLRDLELDLTRARAGMLGREADLSALARTHDALRRRHDEGERRAATLRRHNEELRVEGETVRQKLLLALSLLEEYQAQLARLGAL